MRWKVLAGLGGVVVLAGAAAVFGLFPVWGGNNLLIIDVRMHMYLRNKYGDPPEPNLITETSPPRAAMRRPSTPIWPKWNATISC